MYDKTYEQRFIKRVANLITQTSFKLMKKYKCRINELDITDQEIANIANLVEQDTITMKTGYKIFEFICNKRRGVLTDD